VCVLRQAGGTPVSSTNKTDRHDITEILLKESDVNHPNPLRFMEQIKINEFLQ
jgi:Tfp pilus assembly protein PilW